MIYTQRVSDKQRTPKGAELPVRKHKDFLKNLKKAAETHPHFVYPHERHTRQPSAKTRTLPHSGQARPVLMS